MNMHFWQRNFGRLIKCTAAFLSVFTMVFSPVAVGQEAQKLSQAQIAMAVKDLGLNRSNTTLGQVWDQYKQNMPEYMAKEFENYVKENRNMRMPVVTVDSVKSATGEEIPVVRFTHEGKTDTIQFFGQERKFITFNGVPLSENDMLNLRHAVDAVADTNPRTRVQHKAYKEEQKRKLVANKMIRDLSRFKGFPRMTPQWWKSMTKEQRAGHIVAMRTLWQDARKVNAESYKKNKKSPTKKKTRASSDFNTNHSFSFLRLVSFSKLAVASEGSAATEVPAPLCADAGGIGIAWVGQCVVAGYIGTYGPIINQSGRTVCGCSLSAAVTNNPEEYGSANQACRYLNNDENFAACNPLIYGYSRSNPGQPICIDKRTAEMQTATHWSSTCDSNSRLSTTEISSTTLVALDQAEERGRVLDEVEAQQRAQSEQYEWTKKYLDSVLSQGDSPNTVDNIISGVWSAELDEALLKIQRDFENEIRQATSICREKLRESDANEEERNQDGACLQLHRRWLFTEHFIAKYRTDKACPSGTKYVGAYAADETVLGAAAKTALNKLSSTSQQGNALCACDPQPSGQEGLGVQLGTADDAAGRVCSPSVVAPIDPVNPNPVNPGPPGPPAQPQPDQGITLWGVALGLAIVAGILCLTRTFICKRDRRTPPTPPPPTCPNPLHHMPTPSSSCVCRQPPSCVAPAALNQVTCSCVTSCPPNQGLHNGICVPQCSDGSYQPVCPGEGGTNQNPDDNNNGGNGGWGGVGN